jgi:hypothetical protein
MAAPIIVPFRGDGGGVSDLTWGQRQIWQAMVDTNTSQSMSSAAPLRGKTAADIAVDLEFLMRRHESLRTRLRFDDAGRPAQVISASGEIALHIVDAAGADPERVAGDLADRWEESVFDYADEWPIRVAVVRHRGVDTHVVLTMCHLAADGMGIAVLYADLAARDPATGRASPVTAMQPRQLAAVESTPAARRRSDLTLEYWERVLRSVAPRRFRRPGQPRDPRYWQVTLTSPAMYLATRAVAARTGRDPAPVLLAAFVVALARVHGINPVVTQTIVSNRFRPELARVVGPVNQNGLLVVDVADTTFDAAVDRARAASLIGSKHAYYDPDRLVELIARIDRERGEQIDIACVFNNQFPEPVGPDPTPDQLAAALPATVLTWDRPLALFNERLMVTVNDVPGTIEVMAEVDTCHVAPADVDAMLHGMVATVVEAAFDPAAPTRVPAVIAGKGPHGG